jgi:hypothetical protein
VRHEHEWRVWHETKLPAGKILMPGVVSHATNLVEHPLFVSDRILRYAAIVGRENVIAGTDCGLGGRSTPTLPGPKLQTLVEGAHLASTSLWPKLNLLVVAIQFRFRLSRVPPAMSHTTCRYAPRSVRHEYGAALRCRHDSGDRGMLGKVPAGSCRSPGPGCARLDSVR